MTRTRETPKYQAHKQQHWARTWTPLRLKAPPNPHFGRFTTMPGACHMPDTEDTKTTKAGDLQELTGRDVAVTVRLIPGIETRKEIASRQPRLLGVTHGPPWIGPPNMESGRFWNTPQALKSSEGSPHGQRSRRAPGHGIFLELLSESGAIRILYALRI